MKDCGYESDTASQGGGWVEKGGEDGLRGPSISMQEKQPGGQVPVQYPSDKRS
jgi:hypothetical protein